MNELVQYGSQVYVWVEDYGFAAMVMVVVEKKVLEISFVVSR